MTVLKKGDLVAIENNSIFEMMGHEVVTGTVITLRGDNSGFSIKCQETGAMETVDFNDGIITVKNG